MSSMNQNVIPDIRQLLQMSLACIESGELDRAAWRLADAGGLLREALGPQAAGEDMMGRDSATGRGYMLPSDLIAQVEVRNVYGNEAIYPANFQAERFAAIAGKKTLSRTDLMNIKALGFAVEEVSIKKLAA